MRDAGKEHEAGRHMSSTDRDEALISVSIDELDILTLHVGDKAQVTIDALPGRAFDGVVTAVNTGRSNSGGNTPEYSVPKSRSGSSGLGGLLGGGMRGMRRY